MHFAVKNLGEISCAHRLHLHKGECQYIHGHNYKVEIVATALVPDHQGFVCDFAELKKMGEVLKEYDHRLLLYVHDPLTRKLLPIIKDHIKIVAFLPTVENLAEHWLKEFQQEMQSNAWEINEIHVWETANNYVAFTKASSGATDS